VRGPATRAAQVVALPLILLGAWWWTSASSGNFYFPPLSRILATFPDTWLTGGSRSRLVSDVLPSLARLLAG
jgi:hypothetical protein